MGGYELVLKECNAAKNMESTWKVEQVYKADHSQWKVRLDILETIYEETDNLIKFISEIINMKNNLEINLKSGKAAKALLVDVETFARNIEFDVEEFKRSLDMITFKTMKPKKTGLSGFGCGVNNPALACCIIKNL